MTGLLRRSGGVGSRGSGITRSGSGITHGGRGIGSGVAGRSSGIRSGVNGRSRRLCGSLCGSLRSSGFLLGAGRQRERRNGGSKSKLRLHLMFPQLERASEWIKQPS